jgi:CDP-diglyceride synthetase
MRLLRTVHWVAFCTLWPPTLWAATITFGDSMRAITGASIVGWLLLSTLSGVTALFHRIDRELKRTGRRLPNPGIFVAAHLFGSWTAGAFAYFAGESFGAPGLATASSIIVFSFAGAALLEKVVEARLKVGFDRDPPVPPAANGVSP